MVRTTSKTVHTRFVVGVVSLIFALLASVAQASSAQAASYPYPWSANPTWEPRPPACVALGRCTAWEQWFDTFTDIQYAGAASRVAVTGILSTSGMTGSAQAAGRRAFYRTDVCGQRVRFQTQKMLTDGYQRGQLAATFDVMFKLGGRVGGKYFKPYAASASVLLAAATRLAVANRMRVASLSLLLALHTDRCI